MIFIDKLKRVKQEIEVCSKLKFGNLDADIVSLKNIALELEHSAEKPNLLKGGLEEWNRARMVRLD